MINHKRAQKIVDSIIPGKKTIPIFTHNKLWLRSVRTIWEAFYDASFWQCLFLSHTFPDSCVQTMFFQEQNNGPMDQSSEEPRSIGSQLWWPRKFQDLPTGQGTITAVQILGRDVNIIVDQTKLILKKTKTMPSAKNRECHHPFFFGGISV